MYLQQRKKESSVMPKIIAVVGLVVVGGLGVAYWRMHQFEQKEALKTDLAAALGSGSHAAIKPALEQMSGLSLSTDQQASDLVTQATWVLWADEGIKVGEQAPDPAALDAITEDSTLPLVVARAERDLMRRDLSRGTQFLAKAAQKHPKEPVLAELKSRYLLAEAEADPAAADGAVSSYFTAMEELGAAPPEAMPVSRGRIAVGYARACELANNRDGAANNYKAATQAAPDLLWATIRSEMIQVPFDADLATADAALQKVLESHKDALSPRQVATVHLERAHRALDTYDTKKGIEALTAAVAADATCSDCAYQLGQLYLDLGKSELALKQLEAAQAIAPLDMRVITARVTALLARGDAAGAKTQVDQIPEPYNDFRYARVLKARLQRESGAIADGPAMVDAAVKSKPDFFEGKLELALLKRAQKSADAEKLFRDLVPNVKTAGRYALGPVLQAYAASVSAAKKRAAAVAEAQGPAESDENAQALLILGEALIAAGDKAGAEKLLTEAKQFGDLPKIDTLLTQVAAK